MDDERFDDLMQQPYRVWIDHYHRIMKLPEMERELGEIIGELPDAVYDAMPSFMEAATRFLIDQPQNWRLPGTQIATLIALIADGKIPAIASDFTGDEQDSLYGALFDIVTLFFAARAAESDELCRIIGSGQ
jgi:hypothetical protein